MRNLIMGFLLAISVNVFSQSDATIQIFAIPSNANGKHIKDKAQAESPAHQEITIAVKLPKGKTPASFDITLGVNANSKGNKGTWSIPFDLSNSAISQKGDVIYINVGVQNVMSGIYATTVVNYTDNSNSGELVYNNKK